MGSCLSLVSASSASAPTAKVIALDGSLKEYSTPVTVPSVLGAARQSCFLCSSDSLYIDSCIPGLASDSILELDQIYFVLPIERLERPLSGSDMGALAIKAGSAIAHASKTQNARGRVIRIMPVARIICEMDCSEEPGATSVRNSIVKRQGARVRVRMASRRLNRDGLDTIEEAEE